MSDLIVRVGTPADIRDVLDLAMEGAAENGIVRPDMEKIANEFWASLHLDGGIVGIVGERDGKPEGFTLLRVGTMWYGNENDPVLEERIVFVKAEFRAAKGARARKLCEFAKQSAERLGLPLMIGILSTERTAGKIRLYERLFGKPSGAIWLVGAKSGRSTEVARDQAVHASA